MKRKRARIARPGENVGAQLQDCIDAAGERCEAGPTDEADRLASELLNGWATEFEGLVNQTQHAIDRAVKGARRRT